MLVAESWHTPSTITEMVVALATAALAFLTWRLAVATNKLAKDAQAEIQQGAKLVAASTAQAHAATAGAEASRAILAASMQPILVPAARRQLTTVAVIAEDNTEWEASVDHAPWIQTDGDDHYRIVIPVQNIGTGVALVPSSAELNFLRTPKRPPLAGAGRANLRVVAPGEFVDFGFHATISDRPGARHWDLGAATVTLGARVILRYEDLAGRETKTLIDYRDAEYELVPWQIDVVLPDDLRDRKPEHPTSER